MSNPARHAAVQQKLFEVVQVGCKDALAELHAFEVSCSYCKRQAAGGMRLLAKTAQDCQKVDAGRNPNKACLPLDARCGGWRRGTGRRCSLDAMQREPPKIKPRLPEALLRAPQGCLVRPEPQGQETEAPGADHGSPKSRSREPQG